MNKNYGKVTFYDGYCGNIIGIDGKNYILLNRDIINDEELVVDDYVCFEGETYKTIEICENIARFVYKVVCE